MSDINVKYLHASSQGQKEVLSALSLNKGHYLCQRNHHKKSVYYLKIFLGSSPLVSLMIKVALEHKLHREDTSMRFGGIITVFPSGQNLMILNSRKQSSTAVTEVPGPAHPSLK